jgi:hypothetical protein
VNRETFLEVLLFVTIVPPLLSAFIDSNAGDVTHDIEENYVKYINESVMASEKHIAYIGEAIALLDPHLSDSDYKEQREIFINKSKKIISEYNTICDNRLYFPSFSFVYIF